MTKVYKFLKALKWGILTCSTVDAISGALQFQVVTVDVVLATAHNANHARDTSRVKTKIL